MNITIFRKTKLLLLLLFSASIYAQNPVQHATAGKTNINTIKFDDFSVFLLDTDFIEKESQIKSEVSVPFPSSQGKKKLIEQQEKKAGKESSDSQISNVMSAKARTTKPATKKEIILSEDQQLYQAAKKLFDADDLIEAESIFIDLLQKYPDSKYRDEATYYLAEIMLKTDKPDEAINYYNKIIEDENFAKSKYVDEAYYRIAFIYFKNKDYSNGVKYLSLMQEKFKSSSLIDESYILKGDIYENLKNYKQAINSYKTVIDNYSNSNSIDKAYFHLGTIYKNVPEVRDLEKSREHFKKIIDECKKSPYFIKAKKELRYLEENFLKYK